MIFRLAFQPQLALAPTVQQARESAREKTRGAACHGISIIGSLLSAVSIHVCSLHRHTDPPAVSSRQPYRSETGGAPQACRPRSLLSCEAGPMPGTAVRPCA